MTDDPLGFGDSEDKAAAAGPALMVAPPMGPRELRVMHDIMLHAPKAAIKIVFTAEDEATGEEIWDPPVAPRWERQDIVWQKLMNWPTVPTIEEALAFKHNARAALVAEHWETLALARRLDDEFGFTRLEDTQPMISREPKPGSKP